MKIKVLNFELAVLKKLVLWSEHSKLICLTVKENIPMFHRPKSEEDNENKEVTQNTEEGSKMSENNQENNQGSNEKSIGIPSSGLSRMGSNAGRPNIPGSYPGYAGTPSYNPTSSSTASGSQFDSGRKLIVGQGISMSGEIEACDHLIVEGKVEAALRGAKLLDITENGTFFGTVEIEEANVAGTFEGDLTVKGRLTIKSGGSITGEISYGELAIEAGALIDGTLRPLNAPKKEKRPTPAKSNTTKSHTQQQQKVAQDQGNGGELPFSDDKKVAAAE